MMIKSTDGIGSFSGVGRTGGTPSAGRAKPAESFRSVLRGRTDTVEISRHAPSSGAAELKHTKADILQGIGGDTKAETLEALKGLVASGNYRVDPEELARILCK